MVDLVIGFGVGIGLGLLIGYLLGMVNSKSEGESGNISLTQVNELIQTITDGQVKGVRSVLGLDLQGEIIEQEVEEEDSPIAPMRLLEMDPFMEEEGWLIETSTPQNSQNEE